MRMNRMWSALLASAVLMTGSASLVVAQASVSTDKKAVPADTLDSQIATTLEKANTDELAAAQNALTTTQNADVRKFAQKMVDDHTKALAKLHTITGRMGLVASADASMAAPAPTEAPPRDTLLPAPSSGMGAMGDSAARSSAQSPTSDKQFIDAMVVNHQQLLGKLPEEGRGIKDKELRSYVGDVRKTVQQHYTMARDIQTKMGGMAKP